jgi:hypothetical protein
METYSVRGLVLRMVLHLAGKRVLCWEQLLVRQKEQESVCIHVQESARIHVILLLGN